MRILMVLVMVCSTGVLVGFDSSLTLQPMRQHVRLVIEDFCYGKTIFVRGLTIVREGDLVRALPTNRSVAWWLFNGDKVGERIGELPYVARAEVVRCGLFSWGCFEVVLTEHQPDLIALVKDQAWIISSDGSFIIPVDGKDEINRAFSDYTEHKGKSPVVVSGLFTQKSSPEVVRARMAYVRQAVDIIEHNSGFSVKTLSLLKNAELLVQFDDLQPTARFDSAQLDLERLADEAVRLKMVVLELGARKSHVKEIDLAFNRIAVVKAFDFEDSGDFLIQRLEK